MPQRIDFQSFDDPQFWVGRFTEIAPEFGYVTWTWNALHADLCDLFWAITGIERPELPRAIWYAIKSDSGQRDILKAANLVAQKYDTACRDEVEWLIGEVGQIAAFRNDAIHTLWTQIIPNRAAMTAMRHMAPWDVAPDVDRGHPRGKRLVGKSVRDVFRALCGYCMTLIQYSRHLDTRVRGWHEGDPLPERPVRPPSLFSGQGS